jgi:hypothetical protein
LRDLCIALIPTARAADLDQDSTCATEGGTPARMGYYNNYLIENCSRIVVGMQATGARLSEEPRAAEDMIARFTHWQGRRPESIAADASYRNREFLIDVFRNLELAFLAIRLSALSPVTRRKLLRDADKVTAAQSKVPLCDVNMAANLCFLANIWLQCPGIELSQVAHS